VLLATLREYKADIAFDDLSIADFVC